MTSSRKVISWKKILTIKTMILYLSFLLFAYAFFVEKKKIFTYHINESY